jgi:pentapeptide MXKDX repeat protein
MILVPLIDLKFLNELAAGDAGTSNRRHLLTKGTMSKDAMGKDSTSKDTMGKDTTAKDGMKKDEMKK